MEHGWIKEAEREGTGRRAGTDSKTEEERALEVKADCEHMQIILDVGHFPQLMIYWLESLKRTEHEQVGTFSSNVYGYYRHDRHDMASAYF